MEKEREGERGKIYRDIILMEKRKRESERAMIEREKKCKFCDDTFFFVIIACTPLNKVSHLSLIIV